MKIERTEIDGVAIITPRVFEDERGYFFESYSKRDFQEAFGAVEFVQDNESCSGFGVVRGLHFQKAEAAQAKLVRVVEGTVWDVAVDLRRSSETFGRWVAVELSAENHRQLFLPRGMAHGFAVLSERAVFQYKCDNFYTPSAEGSVAWNDPQIGIRWPIPASQVILSPKDAAAPLLRDVTDLF